MFGNRGPLLTRCRNRHHFFECGDAFAGFAEAVVAHGDHAVFQGLGFELHGSGA